MYLIWLIITASDCSHICHKLVDSVYPTSIASKIFSATGCNKFLWEVLASFTIALNAETITKCCSRGYCLKIWILVTYHRYQGYLDPFSFHFRLFQVHPSSISWPKPQFAPYKYTPRGGGSSWRGAGGGAWPNILPLNTPLIGIPTVSGGF